MSADISESTRRSRYQTANEFIVLDEIDAVTGSVKSCSFLHEGARGAIVLSGAPGNFLQPRLSVDGQVISLADARWRLFHHWIPHFEVSTPAGVLQCTYLAPHARRGFAMRMEFRTSKRADIELSFLVNWTDTLHVSVPTRHMNGVRFAGLLPESSSGQFLAFRAAWPLFGVGLVSDGEWEMSVGERFLSADEPEIPAADQELVTARYTRTGAPELGESLSLTLCVGVGAESLAGIACAEDLLHEKWDDLLSDTRAWMSEKEIHCTGPAQKYRALINENAIFAHLYSQAATIDTERMVVVSSRSPRYKYTGSYRDRDACLYSLPSVLLIDPAQARRMLEYAFNVQKRNTGARSRTMDGVLLEPGFTLDGLVAPLRALWMYVDLTHDLTILFDQSVQLGVNSILEALELKSHPHLSLYRTSLTPAEKPASREYVTYDNILVWRALVDLSDLYRRIRDVERSSETEMWGRDVQEAVMQNCVVDGPYGQMFCYAVDQDGQAELGDDPEGSLEVITHLEFCRADSKVFLNTQRWIRENQARSAGLVNMLTLANRLLASDKDVLMDLLSANLDEGIACQEIDGEGRATRGFAWAAGAGYLSYALVRALEEHVDPPVLRRAELRRGRISRSTLRPGVGWI